MDPKVEAHCEESIAALTSLYKEKRIEPEHYFKGMLVVAYEYSQAGDNLRAASIAQGIPQDYYRERQRQQMIEDPNFSYISYTLALNLFQAGYVSLSGPAPTTTQQPARA